MSNWIKLSYQLPPKGESVLISDGRYVSMAAYQTGDRQDWSAPYSLSIEDYDFKLDFEPTFWMMPPEAPKE